MVRVNADQKVATGGAYLKEVKKIMRGRTEKKERCVSLVSAVVESRREFLLPSVVAIGRPHRTNYRLGSCSWVPSRVAWIGGEALLWSTPRLSWSRHTLYIRERENGRSIFFSEERNNVSKYLNIYKT